MDRLRDIYLQVEGWLELGNSREAELAFQQLPARALTTKRGLTLWLRLSLTLQRWPEVEAAARELRTIFPAEASLVLHEAEALGHQGRGLQALLLLADNAACFTGPAWESFLATLKNHAAQVSLPAPGADLLQNILTGSLPAGKRVDYTFRTAAFTPHIASR
jgi:hypothetical protein